MKIYDTNHHNSAGIVCKMPNCYKYAVSALPEVEKEYRKFSFGYLLTQQFSDKDYLISIYKFKINRTSRIRVISGTGSTLQLVFNSTRSYPYIGIPNHKEIRLLNLKGEIIETELGPNEIEFVEINFTSSGINHYLNCPDLTELLMWQDLSYPKVDLALTGTITFIPKYTIYKMKKFEPSKYSLPFRFSLCAMELIVHYCDEITEEKRLRSIHYFKNKAKIIQISYEIRKSPLIDIDIAYFLNKYSISRQSLENGFIILYGISFMCYLHSKCMATGSYLLSEGWTLNAVSVILGYAKSGDFIKAYEKYINRTDKIFIKDKILVVSQKVKMRACQLN